MSETARLLERIEEGIVEHGGDLGGWTRLEGESLQIFDGRVTLRAQINDCEGTRGHMTMHAHVFATLHEYDDEEVDACLFGFGESRKAALEQAAEIWLTCLVGPLRSFLDNKPVCLTLQADVPEGDLQQGYSPGDFGLPGLRAYVSPLIVRGFENTPAVQTELDDSKPWFRFAAESAAPRRVHVAKVSLLWKATHWERTLEIDGHDVCYNEADWQAGVRPRDNGYLLRFAVFEFPPDSPVVRQRAELERTILRFAEVLPKASGIEQVIEQMTREGFDADVIDEVESFSTLAFGRTMFSTWNINYSPTVIRARRDGRVELDVPLMSLPAYTRALALSAHLLKTISADDWFALAMYNGESRAILQAVEAAKPRKFDFSAVQMPPFVVPERGASEATCQAAMAALQSLLDRERAAQKPWWKFW